MQIISFLIIILLFDIQTSLLANRIDSDSQVGDSQNKKGIYRHIKNPEPSRVTNHLNELKKVEKMPPKAMRHINELEKVKLKPSKAIHHINELKKIKKMPPKATRHINELGKILTRQQVNSQGNVNIGIHNKVINSIGGGCPEGPPCPDTKTEEK